MVESRMKSRFSDDLGGRKRMATILQQYEEKMAGYRAQSASGRLRPEDLMALQETSYRACVLGTVQAIGASIPPNTDIQALGLHYAVASTYLKMLTRERRFGPGEDEGAMQRREELKKQLAAIIQVMENKCSRLDINEPDSYRACMEAVLGEAIPAWLEYRDTYVCLTGQDAAGTAKETGPDAYMATGSRNPSGTNQPGGNTEPYQTMGSPKQAAPYQAIGNPQPSGPYQAGGNPRPTGPYRAYGNPQPTGSYQAGGNAQQSGPYQGNWNTGTPAQYQAGRAAQAPGQCQMAGGQWAAPAQQPAGGTGCQAGSQGRPAGTAWQPQAQPYRNAG